MIYKYEMIEFNHSDIKTNQRKNQIKWCKFGLNEHVRIRFWLIKKRVFDPIDNWSKFHSADYTNESLYSIHSTCACKLNVQIVIEHHGEVSFHQLISPIFQLSFENAFNLVQLKSHIHSISITKQFQNQCAHWQHQVSCNFIFNWMTSGCGQHLNGWDGKVQIQRSRKSGDICCRICTAFVFIWFNCIQKWNTIQFVYCFWGTVSSRTFQINNAVNVGYQRMTNKHWTVSLINAQTFIQRVS